MKDNDRGFVLVETGGLKTEIRSSFNVGFEDGLYKQDLLPITRESIELHKDDKFSKVTCKYRASSTISEFDGDNLTVNTGFYINDELVGNYQSRDTVENVLTGCLEEAKKLLI